MNIYAVGLYLPSEVEGTLDNDEAL